MGRYTRGAGRALAGGGRGGGGGSGAAAVINTRAILGADVLVYDFGRYDAGLVYGGPGPLVYDVGFYDAGGWYDTRDARLLFYDRPGHGYDQGRLYLG